tara:strand:- start:14 stop:211 length:198 start_codon:yes stop_codon:yes gene_type:complete
MQKNKLNSSSGVQVACSVVLIPLVGVSTSFRLVCFWCQLWLVGGGCSLLAGYELSKIKKIVEKRT